MLAVYCVIFVCLAMLMIAYLIYLEGKKELAFMLRNCAFGMVLLYTFIVLFLSFDKVGW